MKLTKTQREVLVKMAQGWGVVYDDRYERTYLREHNRQGFSEVKRVTWPTWRALLAVKAIDGCEDVFRLTPLGRAAAKEQT